MIVRRTFFWVLLVGIGVGLVGLLGGPSAKAQAVEQPANEDGRAAAADTLTAEEAVHRALEENPSVQAARQQQAAAAASVREAQSERFPVVQGQASYRRLSDNVDYTVDLPSLPGGDGQPVTFAPAILNRYSFRATAELPVFTGFRISNQLDAARAQTRAGEAQVEATQNDVVYQTRATYWRLYEAQAREETAADALRQIERRLTDVRNRATEGMATEADVLRMQAQRDRFRVEQIQAAGEVQSARRSLNDQLGRPVDAPVVLADTVTIDDTTGDEEALVARAEDQHPELEALEHTVQAREAEVNVVQSNWYPQVRVSGSYLYARPNEQLFPPEDRFRGTWEAGVTLSWSLSVGGQTGAVTDRAQAQQLQSQYELEDQRQAVAVEVRQQVQNVEQAREAVAAAETSVQSARAAYQSVQSRYDEGMTIVSDLLDAERALHEARAQLASAQADYALARAALARALGRGADRGGH